MNFKKAHNLLASHLNKLAVAVRSADEVLKLKVAEAQQREGCPTLIVVLILRQQAVNSFNVLRIQLLYYNVVCTAQLVTVTGCKYTNRMMRKRIV